MTVTAPPRPPQPSDPAELQEIEALEALIEDAGSKAASKLDDYVKKLTAVDPINWISGAASDSTFLVQDGTRDPWNPRSDVLALYAAAQGTKELRFYRAGHELNAAASADRVTWLLRQLRR